MHFKIRISLLLILAIPGIAPADPAPERLLPARTLVALLTDNASKFVKVWSETQFPALANDPLMVPIVAEVDKQLRSSPVLTGAMGLQWEDVKAVASGPAGAAIIRTGPERTSLLALVDTTGRGTQRTFLLARVIASVLNHKGHLEVEQIEGETVTVMVIPVDDGVSPVRVYSLVKGNMLILADDALAVAGVLKRWKGGDECLADQSEYKKVRDRARPADGKPPHLTAFIDRVRLAEGWSAPRGEKSRRGLLKVLNEEGLAQVKSIAASIRFGEGPYDAVLRAFVYAPEPHERALRLLHLPNQAGLEAEPLVPEWATRCLTFNMNMPDIIASFACIFDHITGKAGDLDAVIDALRDDVEGPRVDVQGEVLDRLTGRVTIFGAGPAAGSMQTGRRMIVFQARDEAKLAECVGRLLANDESVQLVKNDGQPYWRIVSNSTGVADADQAKHVAIAVARGHLMIADDESLMTSILSSKSGKPLTSDPAYQRVEAQMRPLQAREASFRLFARPSEGLRGLYELARTGRLAQSPSLFAQIVRDRLERTQINSEKLPDFNKVNHYLQPIGGLGVTNPDGWDVTIFSLKRLAAAKPTDQK
jgi:hypothetical protein